MLELRDEHVGLASVDVREIEAPDRVVPTISAQLVVHAPEEEVIRCGSSNHLDELDEAAKCGSKSKAERVGAGAPRGWCTLKQAGKRRSCKNEEEGKWGTTSTESRRKPTYNGVGT